MTIELWLVYALAILVLTASPGPSSLLCMTKGVHGGWYAGSYTALGSLTAITLILSLSFIGLGVVVASSEWLFNIIKWAGAAYLIYLGINAVLSKQESFSAAHQVPSGKTLFSHYGSGFVVGASNPKAILFFTALFPQFINPTGDLWLQYFVFAGTFVVFELFWLLFYVYLGKRSAHWIYSQGKARFFNRLSGGVFIAAGTVLASVNRN